MLRVAVNGAVFATVPGEEGGAAGEAGCGVGFAVGVAAGAGEAAK